MNKTLDSDNNTHLSPFCWTTAKFSHILDSTKPQQTLGEAAQGVRWAQDTSAPTQACLPNDSNDPPDILEEGQEAEAEKQ